MGPRAVGLSPAVAPTAHCSSGDRAAILSEMSSKKWGACAPVSRARICVECTTPPPGAQLPWCLGSSGQEYTPGRVFQEGPVLTMERRALPPRGWNQDWRGAPRPTPVRPIALSLTRRRGMRPGWPGAGSPWRSETCFGNVCVPGLVSWAQLCPGARVGRGREQRGADQHFPWAEGGTAALSRAQCATAHPGTRQSWTRDGRQARGQDLGRGDINPVSWLQVLPEA